jgi:hypothetical protein
VISTNYDAAVERALFERLIDHGVSVGQVINFGMPWRDAFKDRLHLRPPGARLAILKLHGSLNWLRCEQCGHVTVNVTKRIAPLDNWEREGLLRSILVTPSVVRDVRDANLLGIWRAALEDLREADEWIFIGHSLPTEDIAIRSVLLRTWHARRRKGLRVRVVQFEPMGPWGSSIPTETYRRFRLYFPPSALAEANYRRDGFENFVDALEVLTDPRLNARIECAFDGDSARELKRVRRRR